MRGDGGRRTGDDEDGTGATPEAEAFDGGEIIVPETRPKHRIGSKMRPGWPEFNMQTVGIR